ncbi:hypothetical protein Tco_1365653 [Tanacetum coccineum]
MIKYSFNDEEEYVAVKEDEYDDLTITSEEACRAYQEIFRMIDEGWMDLGSKEIDEVGEVSIIRSPMCDCRHARIQTHLQYKFLLINSTWRIYQANIMRVSHSNYF